MSSQSEFFHWSQWSEITYEIRRKEKNEKKNKSSDPHENSDFTVRLQQLTVYNSIETSSFCFVITNSNQIFVLFPFLVELPSKNGHPSRKLCILISTIFKGFIINSFPWLHWQMKSENFGFVHDGQFYQLNFLVITAVQLPYFLSISPRIEAPKMLQ